MTPGSETSAAASRFDPAGLRRLRERQARAVQAPWLHREVARRLAERLPLVRRQPQLVLDWRGDGAGDEWLRRQYAKAALQRVAPIGASDRAPWWAPWRQPLPDLPVSQVVAGSAGLLWSCMGLHWEPDPVAVFAQWSDALEVDGFLMFATLGPGSLQGLQACHTAGGWGPAFTPFVDMHDLGDMLLRAGLADPVMDQETLKLQWPSASAALAELRTLGANLDPGRHAGLRTPRWRERLERRLASDCAVGDCRVALEFEIVYGHAFKSAPRPRPQASPEVVLQDMRSILGPRKNR